MNDCRVGEVIKERMQALGLTWALTAELAETDQHTLSNAINYNGQRTTLPVLQRIADALEIHITDFWHPKEERKQPSLRELLIVARGSINLALRDHAE